MIYAPQHHYLIHVDSRYILRVILYYSQPVVSPRVCRSAHYLFDKLQPFVERLGRNVRFTSFRLPTIWGGANLYEVCVV